MNDPFPGGLNQQFGSVRRVRVFWGEGDVPAGFQTNHLLGFRPTVNEGAVKPLNWTSVGRKV